MEKKIRKKISLSSAEVAYRVITVKYVFSICFEVFRKVRDGPLLAISVVTNVLGKDEELRYT